MTAIDVVSMAKRGDAVAMGVFQEACAYIGLACVNICRLVDPDVILLAGGLSNAEGLVDKVRGAFYSRGWNILPHECEIGLASACASGSSGVVGAAGAAACEFALAARRSSRGKRMSSSSSLTSRAAERKPAVSPCEANRDSAAAAAAAGASAATASAAGATAAGENGKAVEGHGSGKANGNGSTAGAERRAEMSAGKGIPGSDPREENPAGASDSANNNGVGSRAVLEESALSEEVFTRAKPEGYGGVGGHGRRIQDG
ncbi:unnamed protein product, partial [Laminaria digitata]